MRYMNHEGGFHRDPIDRDELWVGLVERAVRKKNLVHKLKIPGCLDN
jgi:hypothetical protein